VLALVQWGVTDQGWVRGISLGVAMGLVVSVGYRRSRRLEERRQRAIADQRLWLSRELHDAVASQVSIIGIQAAAARRVLRERPDEAALALERIEAAARTANTDLRRMLEGLRNREGGSVQSGLGRPTLHELPALAQQFEAAGLRVRLTGTGQLPALSSAVDEAAHRIIQEALANSLVHAGSAVTDVNVASRDGLLCITVANRLGRPHLSHVGSGMGIGGMRERAELLGGTLTAAPTIDRRFTVEAILPVEAPDR
jgi:signal transduction histidine kinase